MPFAVFRRHQRKLLAIFAILAMFGFVVADSLPRLLSGGPTTGGNEVVVDLYGRPVRVSDLITMKAQRNNANLFMAELIAMVRQQRAPAVFGDLTTRSLVDAMILEHEADRLGMPAGPEVAREWLKRNFGSTMTRELFELILSRFNNSVSGEQLLSDIANQVRLNNVRQLLGAPVVTPLDVFNAYRDENERVSARAVGFRVEDYLNRIAEPSVDQLRTFFDKYKDVLPDPDRPTPGFKVPRQVVVEVLSADTRALARAIEEKLTEPELLAYYENHKSDFKKPSELPDDLFQDRPDLTPPIVQSFAEVKPYLAMPIAMERAAAEIAARFNKIKDEVMSPFVDKYLTAADEIAEAEKLKQPTQVRLPEPESLASLAKQEGLSHEVSPPLTRARAEHYGLVAHAEVGSMPTSGGHRFAEELFDTRATLFEPIELTDPDGRRFLVRKLKDNPPRVPSLDEVKTDVVLAWKTAQARPIAQKAAETLADSLKKTGGKIEGEIVDGHTVITTDPVAKLQPGLAFSNPFYAPPTPSEISQLPAASPDLRDAYFGLKEGSVAVAPNNPETVYYVLTLNRRFPASFAALYSPAGDSYRYRNEALYAANKSRTEEWMNELRTRAGMKPDWVPKDEEKRSADEAENG